MDAPSEQKALLSHHLDVGRSRGKVNTPAGTAKKKGTPAASPSDGTRQSPAMEGRVHEDRLRTFIELARHSLEEDLFGQPDFSYPRKATMDQKRAGKKVVPRSIRKKGSTFHVS